MIGARFEGPEDTVEVVDSASARLVFDQDTAAAWELTMVERHGTAVADGYTFSGTISSGTRTIRLVPVLSAKPPKARGLARFLTGYAFGFVFEEEGRAIAAVQYWGSGMSSFTDKRVWMPRAVTARERLEFAAIFTAVMAVANLPHVMP